MSDLASMSVKELREIARGLGINYISERKKAELIEQIRHQERIRNTPRDPNKTVAGYFLDGSPIYREDQ